MPLDIAPSRCLHAARAVLARYQSQVAGRIKILDGEVLHGDHVLLDAYPLNNRLEIKVKERVEAA